MKKRFGIALMLLIAVICLVCGCACANSWGLKGKLLQAVMKEDAWQDYTLSGNQEGPFAVLGSRYHKALFFVDPDNQLHVYTTAVYQPEDKRKAPELFYDGHYVTISYGEEEFYTFCDWEENGVYQMSSAHIGDFSLIGIPGAEGFEEFEAEDMDGGPYRFYGKILLSGFNIRLFPRSAEEIRHLNYLRARLDSGLACLGFEPGTGNPYSPDAPGKLLQPKKKGTAAVYSAPYKSAWRAGKGKAAVGLNGKMWVLGQYRNEDGDAYACIRYDVSERTQRIGYALCGELGLEEEAEQGAELGDGFVHVDVEALRGTFLTDDPDVSQFAQFEVPEGTRLSCLGLYNDWYAYVCAEVKDGRLASGGSIVWGFVPVRDLAPVEREKMQTVMDRLAGDWELEAGGSLAEDRLSLRADGTFTAGSTEDAEDAFSGEWVVTEYEAGMNLYWNRPPYEITLLYKDGSATVRGLEITDDTFSLSDWEGSGGYVRAAPAAGGMAVDGFLAKWGLADTDLYGYYQGIAREKGVFETWPAEEQYEFALLLNDVILNHAVRNACAHPGWIDEAMVAPEITGWRYARPEEVAVSREAALERAGAWLKDAGAEADAEGGSMTASLYTGHWCADPFASPWWVLRVYRASGGKMTEIWVNAETGETPRHDSSQVIEKMLKASPEAAEILEDMDADEADSRVVTVYVDEEAAWRVFIDLGNDSRWEVTVDDSTLEIQYEDESNG